MFGWLKSWKERREVKSLVRRMKTSLVQRYGFQERYTAEQVLKTAEIEKLDQKGKIYAVAMYAAPEQAEGVLRKLGETRLAGVVRGHMMAVALGGFRVYDNDSPAYNPFMHHSDGHVSNHSDGGHSHGDHSVGDSGDGHH
jgi:hypothetical protein